MRKAFYYDRAIPPENWLKLTSLLWDQIWISPIVEDQLRSTELFPERKDDFLTKLYTADSNIFDTSFPEAEKERANKILRGDDLEAHKALVMKYANEMKRKDITPADVDEVSRLIDTIKVSIDNKDLKTAQRLNEELKKRHELFRKRLLDKAEHPHMGIYHARFKELYPQLDYFFEKEQSFKEYLSNNKEITLISVDAFLPAKLSTLSIGQIMEFRDKTKSQRFRFRKASEDILKEFVLTGSERDFNGTVERFQNILNEELDVLNKTYRKCKIDAVSQAMKIFAVSSLSHLLSMADIGIFQPAMIISSLAFSGAQGLASFEKGKADISKSPWGYLLSLQQLK